MVHVGFFFAFSTYLYIIICLNRMVFFFIPQIFPKVCFLLVCGWSLRHRAGRSSPSAGGDRNANRLHPRGPGEGAVTSQV